MVYILIVTSREHRPHIDFFADGTVSALDLAKLALTKIFEGGLNVELVQQEGRPQFNEGPYWYGYDDHAEVEVYFMKLTESNIATIDGLTNPIL